jgi:hypothetical protein
MDYGFGRWTLMVVVVLGRRLGTGAAVATTPCVDFGFERIFSRLIRIISKSAKGGRNEQRADERLFVSAKFGTMCVCLNALKYSAQSSTKDPSRAENLITLP